MTRIKGLAVAIVAAWCVLVAAAAMHLPKLNFDNDTWLAPDHPQRVALDNFRAEFEPHEALLAVIELPGDFFHPTNTEKIKRLDAALDALPETESILSPLSATVIIDSGDALEIGEYAKALEDGLLRDADEFAETFLASPYAGKLLSADRRAVLLRIATERSDAQGRAAAVAAITKTLAAQGFPNAKLAGETALKNELNRATREQLPLLLILAAAVLAIFLRIACGDWRRSAVIFAAAAASVGSCLGFMAAFSWPMNAVLLMLPVMVAVIAVADGLHILAAWDALAKLPRNARWFETVRQSWLPCLGASVTSAAGFGVFAFSELEPLQHFGHASTLAILYAYPLITGGLWGGLLLFKSLEKTRARRVDWSAIIRFADHFSAKTPARVTALTLIIALSLAAGLSMLRTETNFLSVFFSEKSEVRRAFDFVDDNLGGSSRIEVVLRGDNEFFSTPEGMSGVDTLSQQFADLSTVNNVDSYLLPLGMAHRAFGKDGLPQTEAALSQELLFLSLSRNDTDAGVLPPYLDFNHAAARLSLQTPNLDSPPLRDTIAAIESRTASYNANAANADGSAAVRGEVTGFGVFIHNLGEQVLRTQAVSIILTPLVIGALLLFQFGMRIGLCGLFANLLPLAATTGLIAWLKFPYDFATILIAGVTLGLSVDNTIHFLHHYRRGAKPRGATLAGPALTRTARPIIVTSLLFCCGLAVLACADLVVLRRFAAFTMFGMAAAMAAVLLFLPAILAIINRPGGK